MSDPSSLLGPPRHRSAPAFRRANAAAAHADVVPALLTALTALAGADDVEDVARVAVEAAADITGARAAAVGHQQGDAVVLDASVGYDCGSMAADTALPLDAGLPLTECVRTGRTVMRGPPGAPAWIAVPVATPTYRGALLVSLTPAATPAAAPLELLADAAAAAIARLRPDRGRPRPAHPPAVAPPAWLTSATVVAPTDGGGDIVAVVPGSTDDVAWVLVADARGSGPDAAPTAQVFRSAAVVLTGADPTPSALLTGSDRALRRAPAADRHVTAAAARLHRRDDGDVDVIVASAGHPSLLLWRDGEVTPLGHPGHPLNLLDPASYDVDVQARLSPGDMLLGYTDGLVERAPDDRTDMLLDMVRRAGALRDPALVVDIVYAAMTSDGDDLHDDVAVVAVALS